MQYIQSTFTLPPPLFPLLKSHSYSCLFSLFKNDYYSLLEMGSSYVALVGAELTETYLPQPPECTTMPCLFILFVSYLILFSEIVSLYISG